MLVLSRLYDKRYTLMDRLAVLEGEWLDLELEGEERGFSDELEEEVMNAFRKMRDIEARLEKVEELLDRLERE